MKYRRMAAGLVCLISLLGMAWAQSPDALGKLTSLIRVIANPQAYDGRRIRVIGYLDYNGLDRAVGLYVTELDGRNFVIANSIDLEIDASSVSKLIGKYVIMNATYHAPKGALVEYSNGHFDHISGMKLLNQGDSSASEQK